MRCRGSHSKNLSFKISNMWGIANFFHKRIEHLGLSIIDAIDGLGKITNFSLLFFYWSVQRPFRYKLFLTQLYFVGNKSIFIIILSGAFTGMVMTYQVYFGFALISVDSLVGPAVSLTLAKELAPVLTGLIISGRAGGAMAAQIGSMKVSEQVDALEVMGINSYQYLAVPRIFATIISMPILSIFFQFLGNFGSYVIGTKVLKIDEITYFSKLGNFVFMADLYQGLIKSVVFGFILSIIGTYFGFSVKNGAEGVGRGTNLAVVWGMISILICDYILTSFLVYVL